MNQKIHVLLVDDDFHWTEDLHKLFTLEPSLKLVGTSDSLQDAVQKAEMLKPDIVVINLELSDGDVVSTIQHIRKNKPNTVFVGQLNNNEHEFHQRAQRAGVHRVLLKGAITTGEILQLIRTAWEEAQMAMNGPHPAHQSNGNINAGGQSVSQTPPQGYPAYPPQNEGIPSKNYQGFPQMNDQGYPNGWQGYPPQSPHPTNPFLYQHTPYQGNPYTQGQPQGYPNPNPYPPQPAGAYDRFNQQPTAPNPQASSNRQPQVHMSAARIRTTLLAVNSPKGGVGKSSFAKELASAFAMAKIPTAPGQPPDRLKVCLVDMDLDYGNIASMLRLNPLPNISNWADDINEKLKRGGEKQRLLYGPDQFMPYLLTHAETGLKVLAAPILPTQALDINERVVEIIIDSLKNYFDIVILDTGNNTKDYTLISLEKAQKTVIVSTAEVPTIRNVQALLETLQAIHYPMDKLHLVLNDVNKRNELSVNDIVRTLDIPLLGAIPEDPRVRQANNRGEVLVMGKDTEFTNAVRKIGHQLVPVFSAKRKKNSSGKPGLFQFFKKK